MKIKIPNAALSLLCALAAFTSAGASISAANAADRALRPHVETLDAMFGAARYDIGAPGLVYGVVSDGKLQHVKSFGVRNVETGAPVTPKAAFRIASMTKMMTSLLIYDLYDQGKIYLDAPAEQYVPALKDLEYPTKDSRKVTVRDMVNHTAGFVTDDPWADRQMARTNAELDAFIADAKPFSFAPGEQWEYSNLGYVLLGRIIENVTGQTFAERMQERILNPLGMTGSGMEVAEISDATRAYGYQKINGEFVDEPVLASGSFDPLGGMWTTAEDYGRFVAWMISAWPARDDAEKDGAIPRRVVRMATDGAHLRSARRRGGLNGDSDCIVASAYGMGLGQYRHCNAGLVLGHGGGFPGFGTFVLIAPEKGFGVFAFANHTYAESDAPVWDAVAHLAENNYGGASPNWTADPALTDAYAGVARAYAAGNINAGGLSFADNFFLDRSAGRWNAQLADIRKEAGDCKDDSALSPYGRLSGSFTWACEKARVTGNIILSPIKPSPVQLLHLRFNQRNGAGREMVIDYDFH
ncbi:MAG: serine hydrolase domain-containing protein [Pseudomonadota bacterium]